MKTHKSLYLSNYIFAFELLLLVFAGLSTVCCESKQSKQVLSADSGNLSSEKAVNINTASARELEKLPSIGEKRARSIVEFREKYGNFRKPEHLILVEGISDDKFLLIKNLVKTK